MAFMDVKRIGQARLARLGLGLSCLALLSCGFIQRDPVEIWIKRLHSNCNATASELADCLMFPAPTGSRREGACRHARDLRLLSPVKKCMAVGGVSARVNGAYWLGQMGDRSAVPALIEVLPNASGQEQTAVIETLGALGDARAVQPLATLLNHTSSMSQQDIVIAKALGNMGPPAVPILKAQIKDRNPYVNIEFLQAALVALAKVSMEEAVPVLQAMATAVDDDTRIVAMGALLEIPGPRSAELFIQCLRHPGYVDIRYANMSSFLSDKGPKLVGPLIAALRRETDPSVRRNVYEMLKGTGAPSAIEAMVSILRDSEFTDEQAAYALSGLHDARIKGPLVEVFKRTRDSDLKLAVAYPVAEAGNAEAFDYLFRKIRTAPADYWSRQLASNIAKLGKPGVDALLAMLDDKRDAARNIAADGLAGVREERVEARLNKALAEKDFAVIAGARHYYIRRGDERSVDVLIQALVASNDSAVASAFLNSGNGRLADAANKWASKHGYTIFPTVGGGGSTQWGKP